MIGWLGWRRVDPLVVNGRGADLGEGGVGPGTDAPLVDFGAVFDEIRGQGRFEIGDDERGVVVVLLDHAVGTRARRSQGYADRG